MIVQSRVALGLAVLALLGGLAAIYVPAAQLTGDIDRALRQSHDALADALKERLLLDAEEDVRALAIVAEANGLDGLEKLGEPLRDAVRVSAILLIDEAGVPLQTYAAIDTPAGIGRTQTVKAMAAQAAAAPAQTVSRGFLLAYGQPYVAAAKIMLRGDGEPPVVVMVFTRIEQAVLSRLSEEFGLANLSLSQRLPASGTPVLPLTDAGGRVTVYLTWQAAGPAQRMLASLGPWVGGVVLAVAFVLTVLGLMTIRAHRRAAAASLANQVLEKADRAKSLLFANLSHEFRTPLNAVIGFSDLMQRETFGPLGHGKYAEYVCDIHSSATHLLGLIEDVLILSRYDATDGVTLNERVRVDEVVTEACRILEQQAERKGLELVVETRPGLEVMCTEKALRQITLNLVGNAIKYTERGQVRVTARTHEDGQGVDLVVSDTGIGISDEHLERITRPFEQVDDVYARKQGGTGLGLSIVTSIVAHAGGRMKLESRPGRGTRVTVTLRRALTNAEAPRQKAA